MSGQWETVVRKKERVNANGKATNSKITKETKKTQVSAADVLPMSDLIDYYSSKSTKTSNNKENHKPQLDVTRKPQNAPKKSSSSSSKQQSSKSEQKPKCYKSIETAFNAIKVMEFNNLLETNRKLYPSTPIVWLRELAQYLNLHINVEIQDVVFSNKPWNYPLCAMPSTFRSVLDIALKNITHENLTLFFDYCLSNMANDMNKNLPALGYKLFMQILLQNDANFAVANVSKSVNLWKSYQNRPNIGLSILWALGQGGYRDLNVGLKVFEEIMLPLIDMKNYTQYILKYLSNIVKQHQKSSLNIEKYLMIIDVIFSTRKNIPNDLPRETVPLCNKLLLASTEKRHDLIEPIMKKLSNVTDKSCKVHLSSALGECFCNDKQSFETLDKCYPKYLPATALLINHIDQNWSTIVNGSNMNLFNDTFLAFSKINAELRNKNKHQEGLSECIAAIERAKNKMANTKKKSSSKGRYLVYTLMALATAAIYLDVKQHGGWDNSCTFRAINSTGLCDYSHKAYGHAKESTLWVHGQIENTFPGFSASVNDFVSPFIDLSHDLGIVLKNVINNIHEAILEKVPIIVDSIETYAPGAIDATKSAGSNICSTVSDYYSKSKEYLLTQVFVGKLAPEEIQKTIILSLETGGQKVQEYYHWLCNKISATK